MHSHTCTYMPTSILHHWWYVRAAVHVISSHTSIHTQLNMHICMYLPQVVYLANCNGYISCKIQHVSDIWHLLPNTTAVLMQCDGCNIITASDCDTHNTKGSLKQDHGNSYCMKPIKWLQHELGAMHVSHNTHRCIIQCWSVNMLLLETMAQLLFDELMSC